MLLEALRPSVESDWARPRPTAFDRRLLLLRPRSWPAPRAEDLPNHIPFARSHLAQLDRSFPQLFSPSFDEAARQRICRHSADTSDLRKLFLISLVSAEGLEPSTP